MSQLKANRYGVNGDDDDDDTKSTSVPKQLIKEVTGESGRSIHDLLPHWDHSHCIANMNAVRVNLQMVLDPTNMEKHGFAF